MDLYALILGTANAGRNVKGRVWVKTASVLTPQCGSSVTDTRERQHGDLRVAKKQADRRGDIPETAT